MKAAFSKSLIAQHTSITRLAFGTAPIGGFVAEVEKDQGVASLQHAMKRGVNYFDSALFYGGGRALEVLGIALGETPSNEIVISFKVGRVLLDASSKTTSNQYIRKIEGYIGAEHVQYRYDYTKEGVLEAFEQSLFYLNKGRIECGLSALSPEQLNLIVYVHDPDVAVHGARQPEIMKQVLQDAFPQLKRMQDQGLIRAYGVGTNEIGICLAALKDPYIKLSLLAGRGTLLCNGAAEAPDLIARDGKNFPQLMSELHKHKNCPKIIVAAIGNSGLGYGSPLYNYVPADPECLAFRNQVYSLLNQFNERQSSNYTMCDLLVRYPLDSFGDSVAAVMSGPRSIKEVDEIIDAYQKEIPSDLWQTLATQGLISSKI